MEKLISERIEVYNAFIDLSKTINGLDSLCPKTKALIKLASICSDGSKFGISLHTEESLKAGASKDEIIDTIICCLPILGIAKINHALQIACETTDIFYSSSLK